MTCNGKHGKADEHWHLWGHDHVPNGQILDHKMMLRRQRPAILDDLAQIKRDLEDKHGGMWFAMPGAPNTWILMTGQGHVANYQMWRCRWACHVTACEEYPIL